MDGYNRYGLYFLPSGALYDLGAAWLGWDSLRGIPLPQPKLAGLDPAITDTPRKYGFHGTIKPPFRLHSGTDVAMLHQAAQAFCAHRTPVIIPRMSVRELGRFIAIVPDTPSAALADLAGAAVVGLDPFRAPTAQAERARRRRSGLSPAQEAHLNTWGYPYVLDQFRFHLTLTGRLPAQDVAPTRDALRVHFAPALTAPMAIDGLCLMGEAADGRFHMLHRYALTG